MVWVRAGMALVLAAAVGSALVSGGSEADPRTPAALPGMPAPFLGTAVVGDGGMTGAVDAYGDLVELRAPGPGGRALIANPSARQAAGSVPADTGIVPLVRIGDGPALPLWRAESVAQRYLRGTNVVRTVARFGGARVVVVVAAAERSLAFAIRAPADTGLSARLDVEPAVRCARSRRAGRLDLLCGVGRRVASGDAAASKVAAGGRRLIAHAAAADRRRLSRSGPLGAGAPAWASAMYARSLLTLRALTDRDTGAVVAGERDGWAYVWPRDAATATLALAAGGDRGEARRTARFLTGLDTGAAARFFTDGSPVPGRGPQGDAAGWVRVAAAATGVPPRQDRAADLRAPDPHDLPDYREGPPGDYLGNALAAGVSEFAPRIRRGKSETPLAAAVEAAFGTPRGLVRRAGDPASGLDSAAAWAVRPFALPRLYPAARRTMLRLARAETRFGITPGEGWSGGSDPWTAPTAWTAWSLAALSDRDRRDRTHGFEACAAYLHESCLSDDRRDRTRGRADSRQDRPRVSADSTPDRADRPRRPVGSTLEHRNPSRARAERRAALRLLADLRRAATPAGALPERVDARSGVPRSTTPLAWPHALAILTLHQLWP